MFENSENLGIPLFYIYKWEPGVANKIVHFCEKWDTLMSIVRKKKEEERKNERQ